MIVILTHELRVHLLEAIKQGELDTDIFDAVEDDKRTPQEIEAEIVRLELCDFSKDGLLKLSDLMRQYALNEISREQYINERLKLNS